MAITIIKNQPIRFLNADAAEEDCSCLGQRFCQLININDATQYQISSSNQVVNGNFTTNLDGWNVFEKIVISIVDILNESAADECDGEFEIVASGGTGPYTYSFNGGAFGVTTTFSGLCAGSYTVTAKDSLGNEGSITIEIDTNIECGLYADSELNDIGGLDLSEIGNCELNDFN